MFPMSDKNLVKYHLSPGKAALPNSCQSGSVCPYTTAVEDLHIKILATLSVQFSFSWSFQENLTKRGIGAPSGKSWIRLCTG